MSGRRFIVRSGSPATLERDPVTHTSFIPGEEAFDCGHHHYFHSESWQAVNGICPLDHPVISATRKTLGLSQRVTLYLFAIIVAIGLMVLCATLATTGSLRTIVFLTGMFPTITPPSKTNTNTCTTIKYTDTTPN
jgi:hypothetical protein